MPQHERISTPQPSVPPPAGPPQAGPQPSVPPPAGPPQAEMSMGPVERPGLDDRERELDPKVVVVWRLLGAASAVLPLGIATAVAFLLLDRLAYLVLAVAVAIFALLVGWYPPVRYARWRWQLTPLALELRHGVIVRRHDAVPYFRIQQIDIMQGPVDRLLQLATLQVTTASASGSVALPGIAASDAPGVRAELLARATDAVAGHPGDLRDAV